MSLIQPPFDSIKSTVMHVLGDAVRLVIVFGSCATGKARPDSDLDIAVDCGQTLTPVQNLALIGSLAELRGRPIDLVDLRSAGEPLLGQILQLGQRIHGSDEAFAYYLTQHMTDMADFVPLQQRILKERRQAWIGR